MYLPCKFVILIHFLPHLCHGYPVYVASRLEGILKLCYYEESISEILGEGTNKSREAATGKCCHGNIVI